MKLVVDANVIVSSLIKNSKTAELLISPLLDLYALKYIFEEIIKYGEEIAGKTKRDIESLKEIFDAISLLINLVDFSNYELFITKAEKISPDKKDSDYFALALKLDCAIWTNDKKLKEQKRVKIYSTEEISGLI